MYMIEIKNMIIFLRNIFLFQTKIK